MRKSWALLILVLLVATTGMAINYLVVFSGGNGTAEGVLTMTR